ncbi:MAG: phosphatidate cytidylyltransferase [Nitrospiria bacterium]
MKRLIVALIFFPLFYFLVSFRRPLPFLFFITLISCLGLFEFYRLYFREKKIAVLLIGEIASLILMGGFYIEGVDPRGIEAMISPFILSTVFSFAVLFFLTAHLFADRASFFLSVCVMGTGLIYVTWFLGHLILLRSLEQGPLYVFFLAMVTWGTDSGALWVGRSIGTRKLASAISPNKTVEGALGGVVFGILMAVISHFWFLPWLSLKETIGLSFALSIAGQTGDLVESMYKRANQVKDSSHLLPGHGGILDKIDSFIFTGPVLYYYLIYFRPA